MSYIHDTHSVSCIAVSEGDTVKSCCALLANVMLFHQGDTWRVAVLLKLRLNVSSIISKRLHCVEHE